MILFKFFFLGQQEDISRLPICFPGDVDNHSMQKTGQIDQEMTATNQPINQPYNGISYTSVLPQPTSLGITNTSVMQGKSGDKQGGTP